MYDRTRDRYRQPKFRRYLCITNLASRPLYLFEYVTSRDDTGEIDLATSTYSVAALDHRASSVGVVGDFGIGAPTLGIVVEEFIALGTTQFLIIGGCGTFRATVKPGDAIIVDRAIRDEGTSHHYLEPADTVAATSQLVTALEERAAEADVPSHTGPTWTTDVFYRETEAELDHYQTEGILTVDMEAAALFAIAQYRDVAAGAIFSPFDRLTDDEWTWDVSDVTSKERLRDVFTIGVDVLTINAER